MRRLGPFVVACLAAVSLVSTAAPAHAATRTSTRYLLEHLPVHGEHLSGYRRSDFGGWVDSDHDGCDTRDEVLIAEAVRRPHVGPGCTLSGGKWRSRYDGFVTTNPSTLDIDHMVPLAEAWQSGAYRWSTATRVRYANDLGYPADLIAVSAHANRSKGDLEPQSWLPTRVSYECTYVANWVAVKWRWHLSVNRAEQVFLRSTLRACGWPRVRKPGRPSISLASSGVSTATTTTAHACTRTSTGSCITGGAFCPQASYGQTGYDANGTRYTCTGDRTHPHWE